MPSTFLCGGALNAPIELTSGSKFPRWPNSAVLLTVLVTQGNVPSAQIQAAAVATIGAATHLSLHTADPGTTGANEISEFRTAISALTYDAGSQKVTGQTDGVTSTSTVTATHWGAWVTTP